MTETRGTREKGKRLTINVEILSTSSEYAAVTGLQKTWQGYHEALLLTNSADLLLQALQAGQISMLEYMMELSIYYDATAQRDYYSALAELQAVAL